MSNQASSGDADVITASEIANALARSGYLIESRVSAMLRDAEWEIVETSAAYVDVETEKTRELDLRAINYYDTGGSGPNLHWFSRRF